MSYEERGLIKTRVISNASLSSGFLDMATCDHGLEIRVKREGFLYAHDSNEDRSIKRPN